MVIRRAFNERGAAMADHHRRAFVGLLLAGDGIQVEHLVSD